MRDMTDGRERGFGPLPCSVGGKRTGEVDMDMTGYRFNVYLTRDAEGWAAVCPDYPDCRARGASRLEAVENLGDVIAIFVEDGLGDDELPPRSEGDGLAGC